MVAKPIKVFHSISNLLVSEQIDNESNGLRLLLTIYSIWYPGIRQMQTHIVWRRGRRRRRRTVIMEYFCLHAVDVCSWHSMPSIVCRISSTFSLDKTFRSHSFRFNVHLQSINVLKFDSLISRLFSLLSSSIVCVLCAHHPHAHIVVRRNRFAYNFTMQYYY